MKKVRWLSGTLEVLKTAAILLGAVVLLIVGLAQGTLFTGLVIYGGRTLLVEDSGEETNSDAPNVALGYRNGSILRLCPVWESETISVPPAEIMLAVAQHSLDKFMFDLGLPAPELVFDCANPDLIHKYWDGPDGKLHSEVNPAPGREWFVGKALHGPIL